MIHILSRSQIISIHAPREGGDQTAKDADAATDISIHAPREGGDPKISKPTANSGKFQSTPPARGATFVYGCSAYFSGHFNPRPPRGGRPGWITGTASGLGISIHAPREGGDGSYKVNLLVYFISIHAPREGGDTWDRMSRDAAFDFNPRPPRGGRPAKAKRKVTITLISIHAPREGGDAVGGVEGQYGENFNPRPPRGGRPSGFHRFRMRFDFNPRPPRGGRRQLRPRLQQYHQISIHAPREGGDSNFLMVTTASHLFQSTPPARGATTKISL